jgi:hypothetical protein
MRPVRLLALATPLLLLGALAFGYLKFITPEPQAESVNPGSDEPKQQGERYTVDVTDYRPAKSPLDELLTDDDLADKNPAFDPDRVHPSPIDGWLVNLSDAVLRLDVPMVKPDQDAHLLQLYPSYREAIEATRKGPLSYLTILPSVNLADGLAKQFDDGLYAALDQAYYQGLDETLASHVGLIRRVFDAVGPDSPAAPYLAAGLELAGESVEVSDAATKRTLLAAFERNALQSKPLGFYTWNPTLERCFRFLRYFQAPLGPDRRGVALALAHAINHDPELRADYLKAVGFYAKLTNPLKVRPVSDLLCRDATPPAEDEPVAVFPASTSRETELFRKLFPLGLPPDANLMAELIRRIRSGEVDLSPRPDSGWYDYQVHALETLLLPEKGRESDKLLLTKSYKKRTLEAFEALMTKRQETHIRQRDIAPLAAAAPPIEEVKVGPRLRIEPSLTYYLRTARAYAFLDAFLNEAVGPEALSSLHGLTKDGRRPDALAAELHDMRDLFYGLYLLGCEDIGLEPEFLDGEAVDRERATRLASEWLAKPFEAPDLAVDTRVAVPIAFDSDRNVTRLWVTLGVRMDRVHVSFAKAPRVKLAEGQGEWESCKPDNLESQTYLVPVDEFVEVEIRGLRAPSRDELRALCDQHRTKADIVRALQSW